MHLDPYKLLGVTPESSLNELRKSYYTLALLMHPDKGGDAKDMWVLESSYKWLKAQLEHKTTKTADDVEKEFEDFLKLQESQRPPLISAVFAESIDFCYEKFVQVYEEEFGIVVGAPPPATVYHFILGEIHREWMTNKFLDVWKFARSSLDRFKNTASFAPASIQHGYEADIEDSTNKDEVKPFGKHEIMTYTEPQSFFESKYDDAVNNTEVPTKLPDYTKSTRHLYMTDYKHAYKEMPEDFGGVFDPNVKDSFEILMESRRYQKEQEEYAVAKKKEQDMLIENKQKEFEKMMRLEDAKKGLDALSLNI
jgi:curved DNA-binding protein CbpA